LINLKNKEIIEAKKQLDNTEKLKVNFYETILKAMKDKAVEKMIECEVRDTLNADMRNLVEKCIEIEKSIRR
jgi:hypothetical protein